MAFTEGVIPEQKAADVALLGVARVWVRLLSLLEQRGSKPRRAEIYDAARVLKKLGDRGRVEMLLELSRVLGRAFDRLA